MKNSKISWTDSSWNPMSGCVKVSPGCKNCYANGFRPTLKPHKLEEPLKWKDPRVIFVCSMSDLFQEEVSDEYILRVFETMRQCPQHKFLVLTKRIDRLYGMVCLGATVTIPENVWIGISAENNEMLDRRSRVLTSIPAPARFISFEPLLEEMDPINLVPLIDKVDWIIVGGESGPKHRSIEASWVRRIRNFCELSKIHFHFRQWGGVKPESSGGELDGVTHDWSPAEILKERECQQ